MSRLVPTTVLISPDLRKRVDVQRERMRSKAPGVDVSLGDTLRTIVVAGIDALDRQSAHDGANPPQSAA